MALNDTRVFISHATEDKETLVKELADLLCQSVKVWYDEYSIPPGGSIFESISQGIARCDFGVVVMSKKSFSKKWTTAELAGLFEREEVGTKRIIPVWVDVSRSDVSAFSPIIADRRAIYASEGVEAIVRFVLDGIRNANLDDPFVHTGTVISKFNELGRTVSIAAEKARLNNSPQGLEKVLASQIELITAAETKAAEIATTNPGLKISCNRGEFACLPSDRIYLNVSGPNSLLLRFEARRSRFTPVESANVDVMLLRVIYDDFGLFEKSEPERHLFDPTFDDALQVTWKKEGSRFDELGSN